MTEVRFYHLQKSKLEQALPALLTQARKQDMRSLIKCAHEAQVKHLDEQLWTFQANSFLVHGTAGGNCDRQQPILLTTDDENLNDAGLLVMVGNAAVADVSPYKLCCYMFDGLDEEALSMARMKWMTYKKDGFHIKYFQQTDGGKWEEKASANVPKAEGATS